MVSHSWQQNDLGGLKVLQKMKGLFPPVKRQSMRNEFFRRKQSLGHEADRFLPRGPTTGETEIIAKSLENAFVIRDWDLLFTGNPNGANPA